MVLDTSALLAILNDEPDRRAFIEKIEAADTRLLSAANLVEAAIVIESRHGAEGEKFLDLFIERAGIEIVAVDVDQAREARLAFSHYGKGRHAARLNFGDCFAYALAMTSGEPLLFKGEDFSNTDVVPA